MMMRPGEPMDGGSRRPASSASLALFLSLSLLLLAFFIVLTTLSTTEETRVRAALDSLSRTFADGHLPRGTPLTAVTGPVIGDSRPFEAELADLVATLVPAAVVPQAAVRGESEVLLRADALFEPDGAALRPARLDLLDRLVATLSAAPPGVALTMEFTLGTDYDSSRMGTVSGGDVGPRVLQRARAVGFARAMLARGIPPSAFAVGLDPALGDQVRLRFRVLDLAEGAQGGQG